MLTRLLAMKLKTNTVVTLDTKDAKHKVIVMFDDETNTWKCLAREVGSHRWIEEAFDTSAEALDMAYQIMGAQNA